MDTLTTEQLDALLVLGRLAAEIVLSGSEGLCSPEIAEAIRTAYVLLYPPQRGLTEQERQWAREIDMTGVEAELNPAPPILTLGDKVRRAMGEGG